MNRIKIEAVLPWTESLIHSQMNSNLFPAILLAQTLTLLLLLPIIPSMAAPPSSGSSSSEPKVHIIYTERPEGVEPEAYHIRTLTSVLGSEDAAKEALLYSYKHAASGFSAKLTADQVSQISKQPGVLQVVPSQTVQLHSGQGMKQV
ncbi:subtilisin-like protease SBT3.15 [Andrographis paniculata]|uniref:subtilisin-like protease SBT3.15 n=1 Tax=Andrographis paniculata TaxID=175694 RepID=UPI0021E7554E|nr:subtilisin-like protease SBT3.15 [Andrographis paniculata]